MIRILQPLSVEQGEARASLYPAETRHFDFEITFATDAIGTQRFSLDLTPESFRREIAPARTFGFVHELDALLKAGLATKPNVKIMKVKRQMPYGGFMAQYAVPDIYEAIRRSRTASRSSSSTSRATSSAARGASSSAGTSQ